MNKKGKLQFIFGLVMSSTMMFTSCKKAVIKTDSEVNAEYLASNEKMSGHNERMNGADWFKTIVYADGDLTNQIPSLTKYSPLEMGLTADELTEFRLMQDKVISQIDIDNPEFLNSYEKAMESGDPVQIEEKMNESKVVLYNATKIVLDAEGVDLDQEIANYANESGDVSFAPNMFAIIIVVVVALAIAINLTHEWTKVSSADPNGGISGLGTISSETLAAEVSILSL